MKATKIVLAIALSGLAATAAEQRVGTAFTYQGRLMDGVAPATGAYDLEFKLFDDGVAGTQIAFTLLYEDVQVAGGLFTLTLDFGPGVFGREARWLQIAVRPGASEGALTSLERQLLTPTPNALFSSAALWTGILGKPPGFADDQDDDLLGGLACADGEVAKRTGGIWSCGTDLDTNSGGDITEVTTGAGSGLTGGATSGSASLAVAFAGTGTASTVARADHAHAEYVLNTDARLLDISGLANVSGGVGAGENNTGLSNAFFGYHAGQANTGGSFNAFFGASAGVNNTADNNSVFGHGAGDSNTTGSPNAFFGRSAGAANTTGGHNAFFGPNAGLANTASENSFFGSGAGDSNTTGTFNSFFGRQAGGANTTHLGNSFFGYHAGLLNQASNNSFFGRDAGAANTSGFNGAFFGSLAGQNNTTGEYNAFFGSLAGSANSIADKNAYFGANAGLNATAGANTFLGADAGMQNTLGFGNVFVGHQAALANITGSNNTIVGANANTFGGTLSFATAIGAGALAANSNTVVLGRPADAVRAPGAMNVVGALDVGAGVSVGGGLDTGQGVAVGGTLSVLNNSGFNQALGVEGNATIDGNLYVVGNIEFSGIDTGTTNTMCYTLFDEVRLGPCASSLRYKTDVDEFTGGLEVVQQLRPVTFTWRKTGARDLGLIAEEVAE